MTKEDHITEHHILPRSRGGTEHVDNIKRLPRKVHEAYHTLFGNLTPEEIIKFLSQEMFNSKDFVSATKWQKNKNHNSYTEVILKWKNSQ